MTSEAVGFDFDAYATALRETGAEIIFTARPQSPWSIRKYSLQHLTLELRNEGGANIVAGPLAKDSITFAVIPTSHGGGAVLNGERIGPLDLVVVPPALKFIKTSLGPQAWIIVSISRDEILRLDELSDLDPLLDETRILVIRSRTLSRKVIDVANAIERETQFDPTARTHSRIDELERSLIETISAIGQVALLRIKSTGNQLQPRSARLYKLACQAVGLFGDADIQHNRIGNFCEILGANERELRRSFNSLFAIGPTRLARLHKVNRVRRMLIDGVTRDNKIKELLAAADVSEPGRFSGHYKALFGEPPSATRKRNRSLSPTEGERGLLPWQAPLL